MEKHRNRPTKVELEQLLSSCYMEQIARKFGVTSNAVKKWIRKFGITIKAQRCRGFKRNRKSIEKGIRALKEHYKNHSSPLGKPIVQLTKQGEIVKYFSSISEVQKYGLNYKMVAKAIQGKLKTYLGFLWRECVVVKEGHKIQLIRQFNNTRIPLFKCDVCGQVFKSLRERQKHRKEKKHYLLSRHEWNCPFCSNMLPSRRKLYTHIRHEHKKGGKHKCRFCLKEFDTHFELGAHSLHCKLNPKYEQNLHIIKASASKNHPRHLSKVTRAKISNSLIKYCTEHPESVSYRREHYSKGSWAEDYFIKLFSNEGIKGYIPQFHIGRYRLDFAFPSTRIDFEVDGHQHRVDKRIVEHDKERTENLFKLGWKTIRLDWGYYQSLSQEEKRNWLQINLYPFIGYTKEQHKDTSIDCPLM